MTGGILNANRERKRLVSRWLLDWPPWVAWIKCNDRPLWEYHHNQSALNSWSPSTIDQPSGNYKFATITVIILLDHNCCHSRLHHIELHPETPPILGTPVASRRIASPPGRRSRPSSFRPGEGWAAAQSSGRSPRCPGARVSCERPTVTHRGRWRSWASRHGWCDGLCCWLWNSDWLWLCHYNGYKTHVDHVMFIDLLWPAIVL